MSVFHVTNQTELKAALGKASGGDTISLAGGNYGHISLIHNRDGDDLQFSSKVKIISQELDNPAVFNGLDLRGAKNMIFDGVVFDYVFQPSHPIYLNPFRIKDSEGITIRNSIFDGDLAYGLSKVDDGYGYAKGLTVGASSNIEIKNNEFFNFHRGATFGGVTNLVVAGNDVHSIRSDGFNFTAVNHVLIQANHMHDFTGSMGSSDHRDMIQFWTTATTRPSTDIVIRGNILDIGKGDFTQSIFMRNEEVDLGRAGKEMFYQNILIENNVIQNNHLHGITVGETVGLVIRSNTVVRKESTTGTVLDGGVGVPAINVKGASEKVTIQQNIVGQINGHNGQEDWSLGKNALVQHTDPNAPEFYGDIFISSTLSDGMMGPVLLADSAAYGMQAGAAQTRGIDIPGLSGRIHVTDFTQDAALRIFDARFSAADGRDLPAGTIYMWSFGDDSQYMGPVVGYRFAGGGTFDVRLTVMTPDGRTDSVDYKIDIEGPEILTYEAGGTFTAFEYGETFALAERAAMTADGLVLGGDGIAYSVNRDHVSDIPGSEDVTIDFSIKAASTTSAGEVFRLHETFIVSIQSDGDLYLELFTADGQRHRIESSGIRLNDMAEHDVSVRIVDGDVKVLIDDKVAARAELTDVLAGRGTNDMLFGNPWGTPNFDGLLTAFSLEKDSGYFTAVGESRGYAVVAEASSDWAMLCTPTQTDEAGTVAYDNFSGNWVVESGMDLIPMV